MKQIIYFLIAGTRGGEMRAKIINAIKIKPRNAHQLAKDLSHDYKTMQHHLDILTEHKLLEKKGKYGGVYFISQIFEQNWKVFGEIWSKFGNKSGKSI